MENKENSLKDCFYSEDGAKETPFENYTYLDPEVILPIVKYWRGRTKKLESLTLRLVEAATSLERFIPVTAETDRYIQRVLDLANEADKLGIVVEEP